MRTRFVVASCLLVLIPSARGSDTDFAIWARSRSAPIDASGSAFRILDARIAQSQLIGLGESVHETEPFLSYRVQFLKDLIRRHRVTALALENGLAEAMAADDFVAGRTEGVSFDTALSGGHGHLVGIRELMRWIREWNAGEGRGAPVRVYGADVPGRQASMVPGLDRLEQLASDWPSLLPFIAAVRPTAIGTGAPWFKPAQEKYDALSPEEKAAWKDAVERLVREASALRGGDASKREWVVRVATACRQYETMVRSGSFSETSPRELAMADNLMWILGRLKPGERAVYWAHNAHVQRSLVEGPALPPGKWIPAGRILASRLGGKYLPIGSAYGGPARDGAETPANSVDAALGEVWPRAFLLSLVDSRNRPAAVEAWLAEPRAMRFQARHLVLALGEAFDAVAYFERAVPAETVPN